MESVIILILIALDQWTKGLAERLIGETGCVVVIPHFFELRLTYNKGAAWSFLSNKTWGIIFLSAVSLMITLSLLYVLKHSTGKRMRLVLSLIISGSIGNLIDRLRVGAVADFLSFTFGDYVFPTFNVADSLITVGTVLLIIFAIFDRKFLDGFSVLKLTRWQRGRGASTNDESSDECDKSRDQSTPDVPLSQDKSGE